MGVVLATRGRGLALAAGLVAACGGPSGALDVLPVRIDFGTVDFQQELPEEGFTPVDVTATNSGEESIAVSLPDFDFVHLCLRGFAASPVDIPPLDPGSSYGLTVSVCGYEFGELDAPVDGSLSFESEALAEPVVVPWTFTPIRDQGDDSG